MQQHAGQAKLLFEKAVLLVTTVGAVADDGVKDMRHVLAKLMHPARGGGKLYE